MKVIKRNGDEVDFNKSKVEKSIEFANERAKLHGGKVITKDSVIEEMVKKIYDRCRKRTSPVTVEEINDLVATELMKEKAYDTAKEFVLYRAGGAKSQITLYSTGCPRCREIAELLNETKIFYVVNNDVEEMLKMGFDEVPVLSVRDSDGNTINMLFEDALDWIEDRKKETK